MEKMQFASMVQEYGFPFIAFIGETEGHYKPGGIWVPAQTVEVAVHGVFLPFTEDDLRYSGAGTYTTQDRKLYTLTELEEGKKIKYKGITYTVQGFKDYTDYADTFIYTARWAGNAN